MDSMALSETLKLLFNLTQFYPEYAHSFTKSTLPILKIFGKLKIESPPLQPPVTYLINALLNLDLEDKQTSFLTTNPLFPHFDLHLNVERLVRILDGSVRQYKEHQLEQLVPPLITLIRKIFEFAPDPVKSFLQTNLLPSNAERARPLGTSTSLSAHILRLSTAATAPVLREALSTMMFELSDKDASNFVRNVGYGFAAGFLMTHNMPIPENAMEAWSSADKDHAAAHDINPITGQLRHLEPVDTGPEMTDEEKEREAERLFVLFERYASPFFWGTLCPRFD